MTEPKPETKISNLLQLWRERAQELKYEATHGTGDTYRSYRDAELEVLEQCIGELEQTKKANPPQANADERQLDLFQRIEETAQ